MLYQEQSEVGCSTPRTNLWEALV